MRRFFAEMNPFLRGMLGIALVALIVVFLSLEPTLFAIGALLRIAFFLAIAFFLYLLWRDRRGDISRWSSRSQWVFYGAAAVIVFTLGVFFAPGVSVPGANAAVLIVVIAVCVFSMVRVWRDEHRYSL